MVGVTTSARVGSPIAATTLSATGVTLVSVTHSVGADYCRRSGAIVLAYDVRKPNVTNDTFSYFSGFSRVIIL